jgi:hypothetical protein
MKNTDDIAPNPKMLLHDYSNILFFNLYFFDELLKIHTFVSLNQ